MSYYTLIIKTYDNGTDDKKSLYLYDTEREALASANTQFGSNVGADTIASIMCKIIDGTGSDITKPLFWKASDLESMKYYVLVVTTYNDGTGDSSALYSYDTEDEAKATTHKQYGSMLESSTVNSVLSTTINSVGGQPTNLYWIDESESEE